MASWVPRKNWTITQVSWTDWTAQDVYYGQEHSFQYSENINCDDEMHGIKLASKAIHVNSYAKCHLTALWDNWVAAMPLNGWTVDRFIYDKATENPFKTMTSIWTAYWSLKERVPGCVFQDRFRWGWATSVSWCLFSYNIVANGSTPVWTSKSYVPYDHPDATDDDIMNKDTADIYMDWAITAILNYNNTRLIVASGSDLRVYYPELDTWYTDHWIYWKTWWKKVLTYEAWVTIVWLTCTFEYLKVWAVDEGWNTKVYYYQGNNNLRSTFVYDVVDLTGERVLRVYPLNGIDYYTTSIDGTDGYINLNKMIWNIPVQLFHQRAWLCALDINTKAPYFVWPTWLNAVYKSWRFYIADAYWVFQFTQTQTSYDKWYMKWKLRDSTNNWSVQVYWVCENKGFLYVSDSNGCWAMRLYDTWVDWYQTDWILISREYEWQYGWTVTKMLDEIRLNYELNPLTDDNWSIDIFVSPNNLWRSTQPMDSNGEATQWRYKVMHIDQVNAKTRTERTELLNKLNDWDPAFGFDRQTLTYAIVITRGEAIQATPIVRQIDISYHTKDKLNYVYNIK